MRYPHRWASGRGIASDGGASREVDGAIEAWERRCRGFHVWDYNVEIEPPYSPLLAAMCGKPCASTRDAPESNAMTWHRNRLLGARGLQICLLPEIAHRAVALQTDLRP